MVVVLTVDQRDSRTHADEVPDLLDRLADGRPAWCGPSSARSATRCRRCSTTPTPRVATLGLAAARRRLVGRDRGRRRRGAAARRHPRRSRRGVPARPRRRHPGQVRAAPDLRVGADATTVPSSWRPCSGCGPGSSSGAPTAAGRSPTRSTRACPTPRRAVGSGISQSAVTQRTQAAGLVDERRARRLAGELLADLLTDDERKEGPSMTLARRSCCSGCWLVVASRSWPLALAGRRPRARHRRRLRHRGVLGFARAVAVVGGGVTAPTPVPGRTILVVDLFLVAVLGGSPVTATVLWLVDRGSSRPTAMDRAGEVLRGGAWIGGVRAGARSSPRSSPAGPRASRSCSPSRASAATPSCAARPGADAAAPGRRRRAVHHRHVRQRAVGLRLRGHLPRADRDLSPAARGSAGQGVERADDGERLRLAEQLAGQRVHVVEGDVRRCGASTSSMLGSSS